MKDYKKYFSLNASPEEVYLALTNPFTIELWTNEKAVMQAIPNTEFSIMDGNIEGMNLEFVENKKIVQQWYFDGEPLPSIVTIKLHADKNGTSVELNHTNIPDEAYDDMVEGWNGAYFGSLQDFFEE